MKASRLAIAALVLGGAALFLSEAEYLRVISATVLVAGVALGVFAIATPEFLGREGEDD